MREKEAAIASLARAEAQAKKGAEAERQVENLMTEKMRTVREMQALVAEKNSVQNQIMQL